MTFPFDVVARSAEMLHGDVLHEARMT
jgi:two-component system osmolarity sensor histidine kinase EnvZ